MRYLLSSLDVLSEELEASHPAVSALLDEAGSFLQASDVRVAADVAVLADQLRALLPALDVEESVQVANGLIDQYGSWPEQGERDALIPLYPFLPSPTHRSGPNPATTDQYQPGQEQWWAGFEADATTKMAALTLSNRSIDESLTQQLRGLTLKARSKGSFHDTILQAGYYAKKTGQPCYVYAGNSYMHVIWRSTLKLSDATNAINNTGSIVLEVAPDLTVYRHDVTRPDAAIDSDETETEEPDHE